MATNKNKRSAKSRQASSSKKQDAASLAALSSSYKKPSSSEDEEVTKGFFSTGQGTTLIFIAMGISRLMQIGAAIRKETTFVEGEEEQESPMVEAAVGCLRFFNNTGDTNADWSPESTCVEDGFHTLLQYKYNTGWQVAAIVTAVMLQCWHIEAWMNLFNVALLLAPVLMGAVSLFVLEPMFVSRTQVWPQIIMALVLSAIGRPVSWREIPFVGGRLPAPIPPRNYTRSLQSLVLLALGSWFLFQATVQWGWPLIPKLWEFRQAWMAGTAQDNVIMATADMLSMVNSEIIASSVATQSPSSVALVLFLLVDKITLAMAFFFAWFYLPEQKQRTLLLYTGVVFFCCATYQYPFLGARLAHASHLQTVDWTIAGCSILTWVAPALAFGWRGSSNQADTTNTSQKTKAE